MDAERWHTWCTKPLVDEPPALTVQQWKELSPAELESHIRWMNRWLRQIYLETDELAAVSREMTAIVEDNAFTPPGAKTIIGVTGPYLIGKSTLLMRWGRSRYNAWTRDADINRFGRPIVHLNEYCEADFCPMVWIDLPNKSTNSTVDRKILNYCGLPAGPNIDASSNSANNAISRHRALAIIFDDVHFLWLNWKGGRQVLDYIKHKNTEFGQVGATLILGGTNLEDTELVDDPQICGRLQLFTLAPYEVDTVAQQVAWQRPVKQIEDMILPHLPAGKPGMLYTQLAGELWYRSGGYLGYMTKLVVKATLAATCDGTHRITRKHVDAIELSVGAEQARQDRHSRRSRDDDPSRRKRRDNNEIQVDT
ncbi:MULTISPECIES: hypothetical protein [unclassified Mycolicibacterium]|uniref:hypothetical protein n=1 Tax=unclassified Mycolicibacterium TaxID=2636767 RepID=UPI0013909827|nr:MULTISPECIES: hypothetical protein [unclassified Mycolicibacterium]